MIAQLFKYKKIILLFFLGTIISSNAYSNKSISNFKNTVFSNSIKFYDDDNLYVDTLYKLNMHNENDYYVFKNIRVDFVYDVFYKKMKGEGFFIQISSDKSVNLNISDINDLVFILENILDTKFLEEEKSELLLAKDINIPKFKITKDSYDIWFDFYPKSQNLHAYFECIVAIKK